MAYMSFEDLEVWKRSCDVAVTIYGCLKNCQDYGLKSQMTRAAVSIASNIAEGAERQTGPEFRQFLHIAKGSAAELRTQVHIADRVNILSTETTESISRELSDISRMLHGLIKSIK